MKMNVVEITNLLRRYAVCPKCGCDRVGNGKGTFECDGEIGYFKRTCHCGWQIEIKDGDSE